MNKLLMAAGTAAVISIGSMASAQVRPTKQESATIDTQNVHPATIIAGRIAGKGQ